MIVAVVALLISLLSFSENQYAAAWNREPIPCATPEIETSNQSVDPYVSPGADAG